MTLKKKLLISFKIFLILALIISLIIFIRVSEFRKELTGKIATSVVNLTITNTLNINMTREIINWSEGIINDGEVNATLYTSGNNTGIVERGNWTGTGAKGIIIENTGTINASLRLKTTKNAHDFFNSSTSSNEEYRWNVTNKETDSCSGGSSLGIWEDVNKTGDGTKYCNQFNFKDDNDEIYIDILLTIPEDSLNLGLLSDTITVTATTAG